MNATARVDELFDQHEHGLHVRTDRLFTWLLGLEWLGGIAAALLISPRTWIGATGSTHVHVYAAVLLGGAIISLPIFLALASPGARLTRHVIAVAQMLMSALLIHLTGGRIETHFHVFGSLAFLAFYRDWRVLVSASVVVGLDHFLRGVYWPQSVYGVAVAGEWRWLEHVWWVFFEDVFLFMAIRQSIDEMRAIAERQARAEQARTDAERANRVKDEFLATLSHELRTPLTSAYGWIGILRRDPGCDRATIAKGLSVLDRNVRALSKLIEDLLDVSRIVSGKFVLDVRPVSLRNIVEGALESVRPAAAAKEIALLSTLPRTDLVLHGDSGRLQQVLWNLLSNAVKFTPRGGEVRLSVTGRDGNAILKVTDTGPGISPEFLPHLFQRFQQADGSTTRQFGGLGLGLAIVRYIVELHGGSVSAASEGIGKGSEFTVTLPCENDAVAAPDTQLSGVRGGILDGLVVLVVEDDTDTRDFIAMVLERSGATVLRADSVADALSLIEIKQPDVMISDIGMAGENGYSLIRKVRMRESQLGWHMPSAALTAYAKPEDRAAALAAGFEDHLAKPVEPDRLPNFVAELARKRSSETNLPNSN